MSYPAQTSPILAAGLLALLLPLGALAQAIVDPSGLSRLRDGLTFAESFDRGAAPYGEAVPDGIAGQAVRLTGAATGVRIPRGSVVNPAGGTIAWWERFEAEAIKTVALMQLLEGQYINYFGREGSSDSRHRHKLGHYWNILYGPVFVEYPDGGLQPGAWHHFAYTWNGNLTRFYVDGVPAAAQVLSKPFSAMPGFTAIELGQAGPFTLDEVRIYNRELTREELQGFVAAVRGGGETRRMALAVPERLASADLPAFRVAYRLSDHTVQLYADLSGHGDAPLDVAVAVAAPDGTTVARQTLAAVSPAVLLYAALPVGKPLADGMYTAELTAAGRSLKTTFERRREVWEGNALGVTDKAISPWTPLVVQRAMVSCWGREYIFGQLGLPARIYSTQPEPTRGKPTVELLARPTALVIETAAGKVLRWKGGKAAVTPRGEGYAEIAADAETTDGAVAVSVRGTLEFDGFCRFTVRLQPRREVNVNSVRLEVALPDELALLFNASRENMRSHKAFLDLQGVGDGVLWDSIRAVSVKGADGKAQLVETRLSPPIWPHVWLGNDDRGLDVMLASYRTWQLDEQRPCMDVVRGNGATVLRLFFVNRPGRLAPLEATFSLQSTPVRPRPPGGSWQQVAWYGWGYFDKAVIWNGCFDNIGADGLAPEAWYRTDEARRQNRWWKYGCLQSFRIGPEDPTFGASVRRYDDEWRGGLHGPSHNDFLLGAYKQWMDKASLDGVYFDNTMPRPDATFGSGLGWRDAAGAMHGSYSVFEMREFLKRLRTLFLADGRPAPVLMAHMTDAPMVGYLGMADFWLDGENGGYLTAEQEERVASGQAFCDFVDRWYSPIGLTTLRVTLGRQWGTMPMYLYQWGKTPTHAVLGLFGLENGYLRPDGVPYDFGQREADCRFLPWWAEGHSVTVVAGGPDMLTAVWTRPGRARILVSNLSPEARRVDMAIDGRKLGLPKAAAVVDEQTGEALPYAAGVVRNLDVPRHGYRVVLVAAPGEFAPLPQTLAPALLPARRIERLCDTFDTLKSDWTLAVSPEVKPDRQALEPAVSCDRGRLVIDTGKGAYSWVRRPFGEDNCSITVKVCGWRDSLVGGASLVLCWDGNRFVRLLAGQQRARPDLEVEVGGTPARFAPAPGAPFPRGASTWLNIRLQPGVIEFRASTDGLAWTRLGDVPREGLAGAPAWLLLGQGAKGAKPFLENDGTAAVWRECMMWFDDLVVGRE